MYAECPTPVPNIGKIHAVLLMVRENEAGAGTSKQTGTHGAHFQILHHSFSDVTLEIHLCVREK